MTNFNPLYESKFYKHDPTLKKIVIISQENVDC